MLIKRLHTIGKSKGVILDKSILQILDIVDFKNDKLEIHIYGNEITLKKHEKLKEITQEKE